MQHRFCFIALLSVSLGLSAQVYTFPTDALGQGYVTRPYERYEAEEGLCNTTGQFLAPSDRQTDLQSEASHQQAVQLFHSGDYVSWVVNRPGDGLTLRFSLPDNDEGTGRKGTIAIYAGEEQLATMELNSYWAWQYCSDNYPGNTPNANGLIRMRFDEQHIRLSRPVQSGETLRIERVTDDSHPYTIDFVELEPVPAPVLATDIEADDVVTFDGNGDIADFIHAHVGQTIYIPEGRWETQKRIYLRNKDNTALIGAGMWYTEIYFAAPSDNASTYSHRGIEADRSNLRVEGLYLNTANNRRYYQEDSRYQVGKAFMGSWGRNSVIRNCWAEHFECGAWIADYSGTPCEDLLVEDCRFRNNYADGINCCQASTRHIVRNCSFRNNGDDDMASWTTSRRCTSVEFAYCTAENNWRASSLGFFGGTAHRAHHLAIFDGLECGARVNADFSGKGFGDTDSIYIHDITIQHCGCSFGKKGEAGDFWGNQQGALNIGGTNYYNVQNIVFDNITVTDSRNNAVHMIAGNGKQLQNITLRNVTIDGAPQYGIYYQGANGNVAYCNLNISNCGKGEQTAHMPTLIIDETCGQSSAIDVPNAPEENIVWYNLLGFPIPADYHGIAVSAKGKKLIN